MNSERAIAVSTFICVLTVWFDHYMKVKASQEARGKPSLKKCQQPTPNPETPQIEVAIKKNCDAETAVDTLTQWGFPREQARRLVDKALKIVPDGDYEILIQTAVKGVD